jgi:hypothetical protein
MKRAMNREPFKDMYRDQVLATEDVKVPKMCSFKPAPAELIIPAGMVYE